MASPVRIVGPWNSASKTVESVVGSLTMAACAYTTRRVHSTTTRAGLAHD